MIFVYYTDDHFEMGGVGLVEFSSREEAADFIVKRMKSHPAATLDNYTTIDGEKLKPKTVEVITKIAFE